MSTVSINPMAGLRCDYPDITAQVLPGRDGAPVLRVGPVRIVFADADEALEFLRAFGRAMAIALDEPEPPAAVLSMPAGRRRRVTDMHLVGSRRPDGAA